MRFPKKTLSLLGLLVGAMAVVGMARAAAEVPEFHSAWPTDAQRIWVGPEYWANRLQDWRIADGRLECVASGPNRDVGLLTRQLGPQTGTLEMSVRLGRLSQGGGWAGFLVGTKGRLHDEPSLCDWRDDVVRGRGLGVGVTTEGELFIGKPTSSGPATIHRGMPRDGWKVVHVDSTQGGAMTGEAALDGDPTTIWHTKFGEPPYPHEIQIDLGAATEICGFAYLPRRDQAVGRIKDFAFYVSADGKEWGEPAIEGQFANSAELQEFTFAPRTGRYVRLVAKSDFVGRPAAVVAELFVLDQASMEEKRSPRAASRPAVGLPTDDLELRVAVEPAGEKYRLTLTAHDPKTGRELDRESRENMAPELFVGGLALVCDARGSAGGRRVQAPADDCRFWFRDWRVSGSKLIGSDEQVFGPILWSQYTLSRNVLKMTAQMPPIGEDDSQVVRLEIQRDGAWEPISEAPIDPLARTATFRVANWDSTVDTPYRLVYRLREADGPKDHYWTGTVRRDPVDKEVIQVAGFTGNADPAWPNVDLVKTLKAVDPDVLFFSGDNIYENVAGYGCQREPLEEACLDYLRKWYFYGWSYRELLRDRPCVSIPDDHDVYQGNLWGHGGRHTDQQNKGGYEMPAEWVNMVQRTQTSHLPDPYDPTPVDQGITVYYCPMVYGRISFAVIEDRKFKTGPEGLVPPTGERSDHVVNPEFDPKTADVPGAVLLGERQLKFLREWAADWRGADMKMVLSQTVFAGAATHHGPNLKYLVADYDSNGWPQTGRNKAVDAMRRGFAFHLAGDQHLATLIQHGIDDWDDAGWSLAVPSVANFYLRAWRPPKPGLPLAEGMPEYTGRYFDGLGNRISVWAATNPGPVGREPAWLHDKKPGFGLIKLNKTTDEITIECWPRYADPTDPDAEQYLGWPKTIRKLDNYGRKAVAYLPTLEVRGMENPVVQIVDEASGEIVYTVRILGRSFRPKVFREGVYTIRVGEQPDRMKTLRGIQALPPDQGAVLQVDLSCFQ